jgi:hypothetical protein
MPMYLWQCVKCREYLFSENVIERHCGKLVQHIQGIEGKGIDMNSPIVRVKVSGYISMTEETLEDYLTRNDPHMSLVYALHMGFVDTSKLTFEIPD